MASGDELTIKYDEPVFDKLESYEEYLDCFVTWKDTFYLESDEVPRTIVTLGYRIPELLNRMDLDIILETLEEDKEEKKKDDTFLGAALDPQQDISCPLMRALQKREVDNRTSFEQAIIFIRDLNDKGQEISGYIDFKERLDNEGEKWMDYYSSKKKLLPRSSDLGYYNWTTFFAKYQASENWRIITDVGKGLRFKNKWDRKIVTVNPYGYVGDNSNRVDIESPHYLQCSIIDHSMRVQL